MALDFIAGCMGGCAGVIVGHPLDTVKVHLQTQNASNPKYRGAIDCMRSLILKDGVKGLYRGMSSPLLGVAGINAIVFGVYGNTQRRLRDPDALHSFFLAGAVAGLVQSTFCSPIELAKTRVQMSGDSRGSIHCLKSIYNIEGIRGVFRGLNMTLLREGPAFGTYFLTYEILTHTENDAPVSTALMLTAGGLAGVTSWLISYPMDVIKTRMQMDGVNGTKYKNSLDCLRISAKTEGYKFLVRGMLPTILRAFPTNAACFTVVTWTMRLLGDGGEDEVTDTIKLWDRCNDALSTLHTTEAAPA